MTTRYDSFADRVQKFRASIRFSYFADENFAVDWQSLRANSHGSVAISIYIEQSSLSQVKYIFYFQTGVSISPLK